MPYRQTDNVVRRLAARRDAILKAASESAAEGGMSAVQIAPVARRAGIAAGTVYRYFPSKTDLVAALAEDLAKQELAALAAAAKAAPGPLSALAASIATSCVRMQASRRLAFALMAEPVEPEVAIARAPYRATVAAELRRLVDAAVAGGHLPAQDTQLTTAALLGLLVEGLLGPLAPEASNATASRTQVQTLTLLALRALGVVDARARGLVAQTMLPA
ncbi:MAG: TetR/AcrR family transcriptional regulator [Variibacter sp.]|nr:TetR/AcrR family transcriptional regulator [Variibacter sp.]